VRAALQSADPAARLEGQVARRVRASLVRFQEEVYSAGQRIGEIDVETATSIIEVTGGAGQGKVAQITRLLGAALNPSGKQVILFAPNITSGRARAIEALGVRVVRSLSDL
jgi:hypothetical protein